jgi:hypothetical protein
MITEQQLIEARKALSKCKKKQEALREEELAIREYIANELFPEDSGSKTVTIGSQKVNIKRVVNYSITRDEAERLAKEQGDLSDEVLSWRPEIKVSGYKKHSDIVDNYITVRPGPPVVEFKD